MTDKPIPKIEINDDNITEITEIVKRAIENGNDTVMIQGVTVPVPVAVSFLTMIGQLIIEQIALHGDLIDEDHTLH